MKRIRRKSKGFTLVEMMIALFVGGLLIIISYNVLTSQKKAADSQNQYINAQQNARVALETLEKELRLAGLNIDDFNGQPVFIDAAPYQIVFNSDLSSGVSGVLGMTTDQSVMISDGSSYTIGTHPDEGLGTLPRYNNNAETIRFTLDRDDNGLVNASDAYTETANPDDYALYREENGTRKDIIAYGLRGRENYPDGQFPEPLFKYYGDFNSNGTVVLWGDGNNDGLLSQAEIAAVTPVPVNLLDKIMEVEISIEAESDHLQAGFTGPHSSPGSPRNYRSVVMSSKVRPRNVGTGAANLHACGNPPASPTSLSVTDTPGDNGHSITLSFNSSFDENSGEEDITDYTVYRRKDGETEWNCIGSVTPKGLSGYTFDDNEHSPGEKLLIGESYYYFVTAWDCRPQESNPSNKAGPVTPLPNGPDQPNIVNAFDTPCDAIDEITVVIHRSPDDIPSSGTVSHYLVYRGNEAGGGVYSKALIGTFPADGSEYYNFYDNSANNISGQPPSAGDYYYYIVQAAAASDSTESIDSNEYGGVYYSGTISSCQLTRVDDYPDDEGESLFIEWKKSPSEDCVPSDVSAYILKRKSIFEPEWQNVWAVAAAGTPTYSRIDEGLTRGAEYTYRVDTYGFSSEVVPSNEMKGIPLRNTELDPPENLEAADILCDATGSVRVAFENAPQDIPTSGRVTHYWIYRKIELGSFAQVGEIEANGSETYEFVDGPATNPTSPPVIGEFYYYRATAYDEDGERESAPSNEGYTMSDGEPGAPWVTDAHDTPVDGGKSITIQFDRSADDGHCTNNVIIYRIYRETSATGGFSHLVGEMTAVGAMSYTFYDDELFSLDPPVDGMGYYYVVRAIEAGGEESVNSNVYGPVYSISQNPSSYIVFEDDFETDKGWTHNLIRTQDDWQRGEPMGNGGDSYGNDDPSSAHSGSNVYGNDLGADGWNGTYKANVENDLITPDGAIDCYGHANVVLQFQRWLNVEGPAYDQATIYISTSGTGGPWTQIWQNEARITDNSWVFVELDISDWADGEDNVALRWRLKSDGAHEYAGWNIDDIVVREKAVTP